MQLYFRTVLFLLWTGLCPGISFPLACQSDTSVLRSLFKEASAAYNDFNFNRVKEINVRLLSMLKGKDRFTYSMLLRVHDLEGLRLYQESMYEESAEAFSKALRIARKHFPEPSEEVAMAYYQMAWIHEQAFDMEGWTAYLDSAEIHFQKALAADDCRHGQIWQHRARMNYFSFGSPDSTLSLLHKASHIYTTCKNRDERSLYDLRKIYYDVFLSTRQFDSADHYLAKQLAYIQKQQGIKWENQRAWMELSRAHLYRLDGHYEKAVSHYRLARNLFEDLPHQDTVPLINADLYAAQCLNSIGRADEALTIFNSLSGLRDDYTDISMDVSGLIDEGLAKIYGSKGQYDSVAHFAERAFQSFYQVIQPDNAKLLALHLLYGTALSNTGRLQHADSVLNFAYNTALRILGDGHPLTIRIRLENALLLARQNHFTGAKSILEKLHKLSSLINSPELYYRFFIVSSQTLILEAGDSKFSTDRKNELISLLYSAMEKFRDMRNHYIAEEARARSVAISISDLHAFLPALYNYYKSDPDADLFELMLALSEAHRSQILSEAIVQSEAYQIAKVPIDLQKKERKIKYSLSQINKKIEQEYARAMPKKEYISRLLQQKIEEDKEFDKLVDEFQRNYPAYYHAKFAQVPIHLDEIKRSLSPDEILIEYLMSGDELYSFVITREENKIFREGDAKTLMEKVKELIRLISDEHHLPDRIARIEKEGSYLYERLLGPIDNQLKVGNSVIIIPDRTLHYLPFEMLYNSGYLVSRYPIQYQSAVTLWLDLLGHEKDDISKSLVVSASFSDNPSSLARTDLASLDFADHEAALVNHVFNGKRLSGEKASKSNFIKFALASDLIHLATHAKADERSGHYSWLAFSDHTSDSLMYLDEIYGLDLKARMVVLSGCETGIGPYQTGEGLISLSRAFSYAGAESIITSLWQVNDEATSKLMASFYQFLKEGNSKDKALQLAKIDYLKNITDPAQADPYYWAGFIAMGDMSEITFHTKGYWIWVGLAVILLMAVLVWCAKSVRTVTFRQVEGKGA